MRNSRWLSLRCLYTRGSCMAVGHISVSRERGAPPKNQIECKNRINSSWRVERAMSARLALAQSTLSFSLLLGRSFSSPLSSRLYLLPVPLAARFSPARSDLLSFPLTRSFFLSVFLGAARATRSARMTPPRGEADHLPYFLLFCLSAAHGKSYAVCRAYEGSALYRQPKRGPVDGPLAPGHPAPRRTREGDRKIISLRIRIASSRPTDRSASRARVNA